MVALTCYGGVGEIGGNKILVEDGDTAFFFDFGTPFARWNLFFEEYLKPRSSAGLLDLMALGLLPPLKGIYRKDFSDRLPWERFRGRPLYRALGKDKDPPLDGVFVSHAHLDHSGYVSFLDEGIPIFTSALTAFIAKAMQDSAPDDFEKEVVYLVPREFDPGKGLFQAIKGSKSSPSSGCLRPFTFVDFPALPSPALAFWQESPARKLVPPKRISPSFPLPFYRFPVDHSVFGASAFAVETSAGWLVYTGDLRRHGRKAGETEGFIAQAAKLRPRLLLCEGTQVAQEGQDRPVTEEEVYFKALEIARASKGLVVADFAPRNVERLLTFKDIAVQTGRRLVVLTRDAYLLEAMALLTPEVPPLGSSDILIYRELKASIKNWEKGLLSRHSSKLIGPEEVKARPEDYILSFSFWDINELVNLNPQEGTYIYSSSEAYNEEQRLDFKRLRRWLEEFRLRPVGLPDPETGKPSKEERGLHASGHAPPADLLDLIREIAPQALVPIHCEQPQFFKEQLKDIEVVIPELGKKIEF